MESRFQTLQRELQTEVAAFQQLQQGTVSVS